MSSYTLVLDDGWALWRWAVLRGTGFPAREVLTLANSELAGATLRYLDQAASVAHERDLVIAAYKAATNAASPETRHAIQRAAKPLWKHAIPEPIADERAQASRESYVVAKQTSEQSHAELATMFANAERTTSELLRRFAGDDRFRQALLWQNRAAVRRGVDWLLRQPLDAKDAETRKNERLVASYLQRYCVKNDTIGFFGPVGWAQFVDSDRVLAQSPGKTLLALRTVYFEYWAIDALAAKLSENARIRPFIAPRRLPQFRIEGTTLHYPIERRSELSAEQAAIALRCDGAHTARQIAGEIAREWPSSESEIFEIIDELVDAGVVRWTLEIPTGCVRPERELAALIEKIDDAEARTYARDALGALDERRRQVAMANTSADLEAALIAFDDSFTRSTGTASERLAGQTYAGRTPLYEDCRRDGELELGRPFLDRVATPLRQLLLSARWYTYEIATRYRRELAAIYRELAGGTTGVIDFARFWQAARQLFPGASAEGSIVGAIQQELRRRWAEILAIDPGERVVRRSSQALDAEVRRQFAAPGPGWPAARHHSPDLMIVADNVDAIARGEYLVLVGEIHPGFNTVVEPLFVKEHPSPEELVAARDSDIDRTSIAPVWSKAVTRGDYYSVSPRDLDLENGDTRSARPRTNVVASADLVVEAVDGLLFVRTRDSATRFEIIEFLEHHLIAESFPAFSLLAPGELMPRVTIDDVVITRTSWRIEPKALAWHTIENRADRYIAARKWASSLGMPRCVFAKTNSEVKPVYIDFDATAYVEILAKLLRGAAVATISEMLPTPEQAWLIDGEGERYTCELRVAAVDPQRWSPEQAL